MTRRPGCPAPGRAPIGRVSAADVALAVVASLDTEESRLLPLVSEHLSMKDVIGTFKAVQGPAFEVEQGHKAALIAQEQ